MREREREKNGREIVKGWEGEGEEREREEREGRRDAWVLRVGSASNIFSNPIRFSPPHPFSQTRAPPLPARRRSPFLPRPPTSSACLPPQIVATKRFPVAPRAFRAIINPLVSSRASLIATRASAARLVEKRGRGGPRTVAFRHFFASVRVAKDKERVRQETLFFRLLLLLLFFFFVRERRRGGISFSSRGMDESWGSEEVWK